MSLLYSENEIRELEQLAITHGISGDEMMSRAGKAAFSYLKKRYQQAQSILVLCGGGNNGGDGYILASLAQNAGFKVQVRYFGELDKVSGEALNALKLCKKTKVDVAAWQQDEALEVDLIVDAIIGIGLKKQLKPNLILAINKINDSDIPVMALDTPSGLLVDSGDIAGNAINADSTVTFIGIKQGMLTGYGPECCGEIVTYDLDLPEELFEQVSHSAVAIDLELLKGSLEPRLKFANKGDFGHVLIVGGAPGMSGAAKIAALGAARVGAGLVSIATHPQHAELINLTQPELMCHGVTTAAQLKVLLNKATVVVVGPGLGQSEWAKRLLRTVLASRLPLIIDADALNLLSQKRIAKRDNWILTPHPGEASRLLKVKTNIIQANRYLAVQALTEKYGGISVLKGCGTVIASELKPLVCRAGNPGMASGGMGDLLSGIIAGIAAQGKELELAAALGVCVHATAGDLVATQQGQRGLLATDLLPYVTQLINTV